MAGDLLSAGGAATECGEGAVATVANNGGSRGSSSAARVLRGVKAAHLLSVRLGRKLLSGDVLSGADAIVGALIKEAINRRVNACKYPIIGKAY